MAHPVLRPPAARTVIRWQQCVLSMTFCNTAAAAAVLAFATLHELQRHNRDDEGDRGSPRAKRTLCSRKRCDEDVCLSTASSWMQTDPLESASRTRSSFFNGLSPALLPRIKRPQKDHQNNTKNSIRLTIRPILMQLDLQSVEKVPLSTFA